MRINKRIAAATGLSRRAADAAVAAGRVTVDGHTATLGQSITPGQSIALDGRELSADHQDVTIMLYKPVGVVVSRRGQGNKTIYDLLPADLQHLKPIGRLDKDSSGLLLVTTDGQLAQELSHPKHQKEKVYEVTLDKPLASRDKSAIEKGVMLEDGPSRLQLEAMHGTTWRVGMSEGRNRQIRRTFAARGYTVKALHRTRFGAFTLPEDLQPGQYKSVRR